MTAVRSSTPTLDGKVALVTGASRGIGRAIAVRLARDGATVAVNYQANSEAAAAVVDAITSEGGRAVALQADIADAAQAQGLVAGALAAFGRLDILVNNAGVIGLTPLGGTDLATLDGLFATNVRAPFVLTQAAAEPLARGGRIVTISSVVSRMRFPGASAYAGTKAAVEAFTRCWSAELGPRGITVNTVSPGMTETDMMRASTPPEMQAAYAARSALGRIGDPGDVACAVAFLCSDEAGWITGQDLVVDGGT